MYYVVQVKVGNEQKAINAIKKYQSEGVDFDVFSPNRVVRKKFKGEFKDVVERCFPGYIFVDTTAPRKLFYDLYWVPEYTKLLGREGLTENFVPLNEDEERIINILYSKESNRVTHISDIEVVEGDKIKILDGPLMGQEAYIRKVNLHKRLVTIEFMLCGRAVTTNVGINIIAKPTT